ncbi:MAG TPA: ABC-2 family transporter protein [Pseudobacteroides sp.]|uniref:ABC transporter permease n=1 Tax=Pseudobacteroides sp. TaxID=1968840 RepID=UPI002F95BF6C
MRIKRDIKIIYMLLKMKLSRNMAFRFSFFGVFFVDGTLFLMQLLMFSAIYSQVGSIGGWDKSQMLIFIGTFSLINALNMSTYFFGVITIPTKIKSGELDYYITKPINSLLHLSFESIDPGSVPLVFASIGILVYAASGIDMQTTLFTVIGYTFMLLIMLILYYDMMVILRTISFLAIQVSSIERLEGEVITLCMKIPGTLFKGAFKLLFYLILPYGIMATIPAQFFAGTLSPLASVYSVAVTAAFTAFTLFFWKLGIKCYKSASS